MPRQESFHVLFMTQALERAGDHAKNLAEEVCHLVSGHSVRHVLRAYDKPVEQMFIEDLKRGRRTRPSRVKFFDKWSQLQVLQSKRVSAT